MFCYTQNTKLHGGTNETHLGNRAEEDRLQARRWEQCHDPVHCGKKYKVTCETQQISTCKWHLFVLFLDLGLVSVSCFVSMFAMFPCVYAPMTGLLQGMCLRQSAGGACAEVHGWEKRRHSADGVGRSFPPAHPWASTTVQLQLDGRHAGHLRCGWIPTMRQGLQGERGGRGPGDTGDGANHGPTCNAFACIWMLRLESKNTDKQSSQIFVFVLTLLLFMKWITCYSKYVVVYKPYMVFCLSFCSQVPLVLQLFDTLHALCNLLVVAPDNLKQVCSGEQLTNLDRNLLHAFVQLRADYRSARLGRHFS